MYGNLPGSSVGWPAVSSDVNSGFTWIPCLGGKHIVEKCFLGEGYNMFDYHDYMGLYRLHVVILSTLEHS